MADCSKTEVFLAEWERMHKHYENEQCAGCPVRALAHTIGEKDCKKAVLNMPKELVIGAVQRWSDEHPVPKPKTYADDFFEKHPNAPKRANGMPMAFRCQVYGCSCGKHEANMINGCEMCWNEPYEGSEQ